MNIKKNCYKSLRMTNACEKLAKNKHRQKIQMMNKCLEVKPNNDV